MLAKLTPQSISPHGQPSCRGWIDGPRSDEEARRWPITLSLHLLAGLPAIGKDPEIVSVAIMVDVLLHPERCGLECRTAAISVSVN
jgi:hypothetical protein